MRNGSVGKGRIKNYVFVFEVRYVIGVLATATMAAKPEIVEMIGQLVLWGHQKHDAKKSNAHISLIVFWQLLAIFGLFDRKLHIADL